MGEELYTIKYRENPENKPNWDERLRKRVAPKPNQMTQQPTQPIPIEEVIPEQQQANITPQTIAINPPRRRRGLSIVDLAAPYNIAKDLLNQKANAIYAQMLQIPKQRCNLAEVLKRPLIMVVEESCVAENQAKENQLEMPPEFGNEENDFFDNYEKEKTEEVESYCTNGSNDDEELYINSWKDEYSLAIYLISIEEIPTTRKEENPDTTPKNNINTLVQIETLDKEQKEKATYLLRRFSDLFATGLDQLGQTIEVQHKIDTEKGVSYEWGPQHEQAFQALKGHLTLAPVL
ncbi:10580_t:CDS:2, partial [Racocetra persica]